MNKSNTPTATLIFRHIHNSDRSQVLVNGGTLAELRAVAPQWMPKGDWYLSGITCSNGDFESFIHPLEVEEYDCISVAEEMDAHFDALHAQDVADREVPRDDAADFMNLMSAFGS